MALDVSQSQPGVTVGALQNVVVVADGMAEVVVDCALQRVDVHADCTRVEVVTGGPMGPPGGAAGATGATGPTGSTGPAGPAGRDGQIRFTGIGAPPAVIVGANPGDTYCDLATGDVYKLI